jgi:hypothetical protein
LITFVISSTPLIAATDTLTSPISSGIGCPRESAGFAEIQVTWDFDENVNPVLRPLLRIAYGDPSTRNVTGARRSFVAVNRTVNSLGAIESFPPAHATSGSTTSSAA